jgi:hypothetical protein
MLTEAMMKENRMMLEKDNLSDVRVCVSFTKKKYLDLFIDLIL